MSKKLNWNKNRDELLGYFSEGLLSAQEEKEIARRIKDDPALQEEARIQQEIARRMSAEEPPPVPEQVIQKAKNLVNEPFGRNIWNLVVRFTGEACQMLKSDGILTDPLIAYGGGPLRGSSAKNSKAILIKKDFGAIGIQVEIERSPNTANRIILYAQDLQTKDPLNNLRITLLENDTELESHITSQGKILFENVHDGRYAFDISSPYQPIAKITLEIFHE